MESPSPAMLQLARRLLAATERAAGPHSQETVLVNGKLRAVLTNFTGADGCATLLRRALSLASAESPALRDASFSAEGRLEGVEPLALQPGSVACAAQLAFTAHLLGLLDTFIGEELTLMMVREACPEAFSQGYNSRKEIADGH
jgi:hypothetical protein